MHCHCHDCNVVNSFGGRRCHRKVLPTFRPDRQGNYSPHWHRRAAYPNFQSSITQRFCNHVSLPAVLSNSSFSSMSLPVAFSFSNVWANRGRLLRLPLSNSPWKTLFTSPLPLSNSPWQTFFTSPLSHFSLQAH